MPVQRIEFEWDEGEARQYQVEWDDWKGEVDLEIGPGIWARYRRKKVITIGGQELRMYVPIAEREPIPPGIRCKACGSNKLYRHGISRGVQRYRCRDCKTTFIEKDSLRRMRVPVTMVSDALAMFYRGTSVDKTADTLGDMYGFRPDGSNVYRWVVRFTEVGLGLVEHVTPKVGDVWVADETVIKAGGKNVWFWDIIDERTRFLLASRTTPSRFTRDAETLMEWAQRRAGKAPKMVITDKLRSYIDGIERVFGANTVHLQSGPFARDDSTRAIERFHGSLKDRTKVFLGFQNRETSDIITQGWLLYYNYLRKHEGIGKTPAEAAKVKVPFEKWEDIVRLEGGV